MQKRQVTITLEIGSRDHRRRAGSFEQAMASAVSVAREAFFQAGFTVVDTGVTPSMLAQEAKKDDGR